MIRRARLDDLDARTLYQILRLRSEVFVVEQACAYADLDGRDLEAATEHLWIERGGTVAAYLRLLDGPPTGTHRVGRVVTAAGARREGHARRLLDEALGSLTGAVVLDAQSYLRGWYESFGFEVIGPEYVEDGIPHVPMRLDR